MLTLLVVASAFAQDPSGIWYADGLSMQMAPNGVMAMQTQQGTIQGQWSAPQPGVLITLVNGVSTQYGYQVSANQLSMQDPQGVVMQFQRANAGAAIQPQPIAPVAGGLLSDREWLVFLETYPQMQPDSVFAHLSRVTETQGLMLQLHEAATNDIFLRVCQGTYAAQVTWGGGCQNMMMSAQQAAMFAAQSGVGGNYGEEQRQQLIIGARCSAGVLDKASCSSYYGTMSNMNNMQHETSMSIINNMAPTPCTQYYDQSNAYLGCW
jgi:hypothetical protein